MLLNGHGILETLIKLSIISTYVEGVSYSTYMYLLYMFHNIFCFLGALNKPPSHDQGTQLWQFAISCLSVEIG